MSDYSILMLAYGQSNADVYPAEPALPCNSFDDPRIVTFNDGNAFRGYLGANPKTIATELVPAANASYETKKCRNYQSFQIAAAARLLAELPDPNLRQVIVRAEGRGGRRFHGIQKNERHIEGILNNADGTDSQILVNMLNTISTAADLSRQSGAPLRRIFINFIHGEADRSTERGFYRKNFETLIGRVAAAAQQLDVKVDWLILDPAGTSSSGSGNNWPCRLAMRDVADAADNIHLIGAGYGYQLDDVIHYGAEARALFGEHFGAGISAILAHENGMCTDKGWLLDAPKPSSAVVAGSAIDLQLAGSEPFELISGISDPVLSVEGFDLTLASRSKILSVFQTGPHSVRVMLEKPPAVEDPRAALTYGYQLIRGQDKRSPSPMPAGRGGWRSVKYLESMVLPGERIHQWVPGFMIPFARMTQG